MSRASAALVEVAVISRMLVPATRLTLILFDRLSSVLV
jgi:hypothetical protein